ncbi:hypothetical protein [Nannocystis bainbridge]|uniref:Uncharacterized protein n=1 Tax=Nannocystis bainbridge TaxID=2995303 RepID=A0ABT5E8V5_9BACT|nr:hypothetical protein [Nannocystis bainbridge]MDC0721186.1 hypothetical protein [Nannocystis bainbridge]
MTTLRRTFRVAASPEQLLPFVQFKIAGPDSRVARVRFDLVHARGFHLLRAAENVPALSEWVVGARVRLERTQGGTVVTVAHAGTLLRRNGHLSAARPLVMAVTSFMMTVATLWAGLTRSDDPGALLFCLMFLVLFVATSRPLVANYRRRDAHFAELADALQEVLAPLSDPELAPIALRIAAEFQARTGG